MTTPEEIREVRLWLGAVADTATADAKPGLHDMAQRALRVIDDLHEVAARALTAGEQAVQQRDALQNSKDGAE